MEQKPLFSIIIPAYNAGHFLAECLDSVRSQTYENFEAVLVDDGSNDAETAKICDEYAALDSRIHAYHTQNSGEVLAREFGIRHANGMYCFFCDADDRMYPAALQDVKEVVESATPDVVLFRCKMDEAESRRHLFSPRLFKDGTIIREDGRERDALIRYILTTYYCNSLCLKCVRTSLAARDLGRYPNIIIGGDRLKSIPILFQARRVYYLDKILYWYRCNPTSAIHAPYNKERLDMCYFSQCLLIKAEKEFLGEHGLDNGQNLRRCRQHWFAWKRELAYHCIKSSLPESEKREFIRRIFSDDAMREIERHGRTMRGKSLICYWLHRLGMLERYLWLRHGGRKGRR